MQQFPDTVEAEEGTLLGDVLLLLAQAMGFSFLWKRTEWAKTSRRRVCRQNDWSLCTRLYRTSMTVRVRI
jgi:hypothetical protein